MRLMNEFYALDTLTKQVKLSNNHITQQGQSGDGSNDLVLAPKLNFYGFRNFHEPCKD
jgi:hypothetical protein